jgi:hypothetical protein
MYDIKRDISKQHPTEAVNKDVLIKFGCVELVLKSVTVSRRGAAGLV